MRVGGLEGFCCRVVTSWNSKSARGRTKDRSLEFEWVALIEWV